jgi:hypothetical protein
VRRARRRLAGTASSLATDQPPSVAGAGAKLGPTGGCERAHRPHSLDRHAAVASAAPICREAGRSVTAVPLSGVRNATRSSSALVHAGSPRCERREMTRRRPQKPWRRSVRAESVAMRSSSPGSVRTLPRQIRIDSGWRSCRRSCRFPFGDWLARLGLSLRYCALIRRGLRVPHARWWEPLQQA